jgi:hypothetical protein
MADCIACGAATPNPHGTASSQHHGRRSNASVLSESMAGASNWGDSAEANSIDFFTHNNQLQRWLIASPVAWLRRAAAKLLPPPSCRRRAAATALPPLRCRRRRQAARHYRTAVAAAALPLQPPRQCCRQAAAAAAALPPSCPPRPSCRRGRRSYAATAAAELPPSCCRRAPTTVTKLPATAELPLPPLRSRYRRRCRRRAALPPCFPKRCRRR